MQAGLVHTSRLCYLRLQGGRGRLGGRMLYRDQGRPRISDVPPTGYPPGIGDGKWAGDRASTGASGPWSAGVHRWPFPLPLSLSVC